MIFKLYKGFLLEKMTQIRQIPKKKKSELPDLYNKVQQVAKNIKRSFFFPPIFISYM
jgi:hypothetical protein